MGGMKGRILALVAVLMLIAAPAIATGGVTFDGPVFGITRGPHGSVLVADASNGVQAIADGSAHLIAELPGVSDVGYGRRATWAVTGLSEDGAPGSSSVYLINDSETKLIADLWQWEVDNNPDPTEVDSNPYDIESMGRRALVVDAGGNDLLKVKANGKVKLLAVFPQELASTQNLKDLVGCPEPTIPDFADFCGLPDQIPAESVPTSVAIGPDGDYYVGELKGFPAPVGESNIWRVSKHARGAECPSADCVKVFDGGFTSIVDLAFDKHGRLYVAEMDEASWAAVEFGLGAVGGTINKCNITTLNCWEIAEEIPMLTSITFTNRKLWATQNSLIPGAAEVFRVR